ncbi:hypothetical protein BDA99DRAFT_149726 [Phascolomyces articulosus]|uniref:Uncharacterized protein n=1 Tax=Phascolomyces articulosus TaxID=60185 RepID=A0AAD5K532_9FUNG|nr:hypothetical protein BDA99DRAFT_149726 [Phascolomyces articulosus]
MENVLQWDENKVNKWLASIGYSAYEKQFKEHGITGDVLVNLDHETLKDLSMHSVGQRMDILKHIYTLKALWRIPLNEWDYVPPTVLYENDWLGQNGMADYRKIEAAFQERDGHLKQLTEDLGRVTNEVYRLREEMGQIWKMFKDKKPLPVFEIDKPPSTPPVMQKSHSHFALQHKSGHLLTPPTSTLHAGSDYFNNGATSSSSHHDKSSGSRSQSDESHQLKSSSSVMINDGGAIKVYGEKLSNSSKVELEASKNVRLLLDDPCSKVITSALKKYNVLDDWQQYSLWIQYGSHDNMQERALSYEEKPLRISQKLKEAKQNPVFVLKHVKDNKPFIPSQAQMSAFTSPRPAPKPTPPSYIVDDDQHGHSNNNSRSNHPQHSTSSNSTGSNSNSSNKKGQLEHPKTAITYGRVEYEVVVPVMSSSISTPTPSTSSATTTNTPTSSSTTINANNNTISNNNTVSSSSETTSSQAPSSSTNTPPTTTVTPPAVKRAGTINRKPSDNFLSELGLESGIANAIYTIMMDQNNNQNDK